VLDQLLAGADPRTALEPNGLLDGLKKALAERVLNAGMDHHLAGEEPGNRRNGYGRKTVLTDTGRIRAGGAARPPGQFRPAADRQISAPLSGVRRQDHLDVPRGMSPRGIVGHLRHPGSPPCRM
jgi:putative transposase